MSQVAIACPQCGVSRSIDAALLGKRARCPACQAVFRLGESEVEPAPEPAAAAPVAEPMPPPAAARPARAVSCPHCFERFRVSAETAGRAVACPHCGAHVEMGADGARPSAAAVAAGAVWQAASVTPAAADAGADDFVAFLNAQKPTIAPAEAAGRAGSRYGNRAAGAATVDADCVVRAFFCPEGSEIGPAIAEKVRELLAQEGEAFGSVVRSDSDIAWGRKLTIEDGGTMALVDPGSLFRTGSVKLRVTALLHGPGRPTRTVEAEVSQIAQRGMKPAKMLEAAIKGVATRVGREALSEAGGPKHLRSEIVPYATWACIFGLLALAPGIGFLFLVLSLILAAVAFSFNRGRERKVGTKRLWTGVIVGTLASLVYAILFFIVAQNS